MPSLEINQDVTLHYYDDDFTEMDKTSVNIGRKLSSYMDAVDLSGQLAEVRVPTLLLSGEESRTATVEQQRFMASRLPNCQLIIYPGLGHGINVIYPEWCISRVREFLARYAEK
jgi:pimeloyl-ACP methyl ester carboxylesterase